MTKQEIKYYSQDLSCALLEPLAHCAKSDEYTVFKSVFESIVVFSEIYGWNLIIDSDKLIGSYFELDALSKIITKDMFNIFFSNVSYVVGQLFYLLPYAIQESMMDECDDTEENSLPADTLE